MNCNHCESPIETTQSGLINCPHCDWKVVVNSQYNSNYKNIDIPKIEIEYYNNKNGKIFKKKYYDTNREYHNPNGPAHICYYENGQIKFEDYWIHGQAHRKNGPARIDYTIDGKIKYEKYYLNDKLHNENGPASIEYYPNGQIRHKQYWINSKEFKIKELKEYLAHKNSLISL